MVNLKSPAASCTASRVKPVSNFGSMTAADFLANYDKLNTRFTPSGGKRRKTPEEDLHRDCFAWIFRHEASHPGLRWMLHAANGGARSAGEAGKLKAMGVRKGVVDIINPFPQPQGGLGFAVELKAPTEKPSKVSVMAKLTDEQSAFLEVASKAGWICGVCTTLPGFVRLARQYLGVPTTLEMA